MRSSILSVSTKKLGDRVNGSAVTNHCSSFLLGTLAKLLILTSANPKLYK